jgi:IS605 OrfB family transposase
MSRFRLYPAPTQERTLVEHCSHARFVWNLAVEQHSHWRRDRQRAPGLAEHCRQLTEARQEFDWLGAGSCTVQQQALSDFARCMFAFVTGRDGRPGWRKKGRHEGFRIVAVRAGQIRRVSKRYGLVFVPKAGWIRFRWSRSVPSAKSYRVTLDAAGRWHIAFASVPEKFEPPRNGAVVGMDRGVVNSVTLSTGEQFHCPTMSVAETKRFIRYQRRLARASRGSKRRSKTLRVLARLKAREVDRRKDWIEKLSTELARRFDVIRVEDLNIRNMTRAARGTRQEPSRHATRKAKLNRRMLTSGWGLLIRRLEDKAGDRVERVAAAYTSQTCSICRYRAPENRKSQAVFECRSCSHRENADINAARNIAAGRAVTARGGMPTGKPKNREPQLPTSSGV